MLLGRSNMKLIYRVLFWASAVSATLNLKQIRPELASKLVKTSSASDDGALNKRQATAPLFLNDNTRSEHPPDPVVAMNWSENVCV